MSSHLKQLLTRLRDLDTDGKDYQLHRDLVRLGHDVERELEESDK